MIRFITKYNAALTAVRKATEDGSSDLAISWQQRVVALEARAAQLRMMWIEAQRGC
jgi:hypothetical protein